MLKAVKPVQPLKEKQQHITSFNIFIVVSLSHGNTSGWFESSRGTVYDASNTGPVQKVKQKINFIMGQKRKEYILKYIYISIYIYIIFGIL